MGGRFYPVAMAFSGAMATGSSYCVDGRFTPLHLAHHPRFRFRVGQFPPVAPHLLPVATAQHGFDSSKWQVANRIVNRTGHRHRHSVAVSATHGDA